MAEIGRLITAMVTPFDAQGKVDLRQAKRLALALVDSGSDGVVVSGSTGEAPTLTTEEKLALFTEIKSAIGKKASVIAGTGNYSTEESIELTKRAEKTGVDAVLLTTPYYNKPTQEGLYQHFSHIANSIKLPCILYNIPGRSVVAISGETTVRLSHVPNIIGTKDAGSNLKEIAYIIQNARPGFIVWSGNDEDTIPIMALGGYGVISVVAHLVGKQFKEMIDLFNAGNTKKAAEIHRKLLPLMNAMTVVTNPIPVKYALNRVGFSVGGYRLPLTPADEKSAAVIDAALKGVKIDLSVGTISKSEQIRNYAKMKMTNGQIAKKMGIRPQFVSNVLNRPLKRAEVLRSERRASA